MVLDQTFPPDLRVENEARSLAEAGNEVMVLAIAPDDRPAEDQVGRVRVLRDRVSAFFYKKIRALTGTLPFYTWYLERRIRAVYVGWPFEVLHVHDLPQLGGGLRAASRLGVPVVADLHENYVEALRHYAWSSQPPGKYLISIPRWERLERAWIHQADHLVVVIEEAAARYEAMGMAPDKVTVVPNTIDLASFEQFPLDSSVAADLPDGFRLMYTGGFDGHRGLASVLEAMPAILARRPDARLVLVGEGRTRAALEALAARLGLQEQVFFAGWQPQARIRSYIEAADLCLVPHLKTVHTDATIPHKLFHYMHAAKPVLVSDCRPLQRIVEAEDAGLVYPAGDAEALARAALTLAKDPARRQAMGERGQQAVRARYNWEATVQPLIAWYRDR